MPKGVCDLTLQTEEITENTSDSYYSFNLLVLPSSLEEDSVYEITIEWSRKQETIRLITAGSFVYLQEDGFPLLSSLVDPSERLSFSVTRASPKVTFTWTLFALFGNGNQTELDIAALERAGSVSATETTL